MPIKINTNFGESLLRNRIPSNLSDTSNYCFYIHRRQVRLSMLQLDIASATIQAHTALLNLASSHAAANYCRYFTMLCSNDTWTISKIIIFCCPIKLIRTSVYYC